MGKLNNQYYKNGYKKCGYLDIFNNTLCVGEEELCPINEITFKLNNGSFVDIITNNTKKDLHILNQLVVSEVENPTIFDINKFYTLDDKKSNKTNSIYDKNYYKLFPLNLPSNITKNIFYDENDLVL